MEVTQQQYDNLLKLKKFFYSVPWHCIEQAAGEIMMVQRARGEHEVGCFGAWFSRCFQKELIDIISVKPVEWPYDQEEWDDFLNEEMNLVERDNFQPGSNYMKDIIGVDASILVLYGAHEHPFSSRNWKRHPRTVISRIIEDVEVRA